MASPETLDFARLLAPIDGDAPTGPDLRDYQPTNPYRVIKDARLAARRQESQAVWGEGGDDTRPDWRAVLKEGQTLLARQSKDLEVAARVTEALVREHGFAGLRDGFRLCRELVEQYWDQLHPCPHPEEPEEDDPAAIRVAALVGLNGEDSEGTLIGPILGVSIVETTDHGALGVAAYEHAQAIEHIDDPNERAKRIAHGVVSLKEIEAALAQSSQDFFKNLFEDLEGAQREFAALCTALEQRCGPMYAPPSSSIRNALDNCHRRLRPFVPVDAEPLAVGAGSGGGGASGSPGGPLQSRDQAFDMIRQVAHFFRQTEPHSVLSWQLDECVRWGRMSLPDLLTELIRDSSARDEVFKRVGIPRSTDG